MKKHIELSKDKHLQIENKTSTEIKIQIISQEVMSANETMQRITLLYRSSTFEKKKASSAGKGGRNRSYGSTSQNQRVNDLYM